jgi:hypothetical protein
MNSMNCPLVCDPCNKDEAPLSPQPLSVQISEDQNIIIAKDEQKIRNLAG